MQLIERSRAMFSRVQSLSKQVAMRSSRWPAQSTVEYALVGALVVIAAAGTLTLLGGQVTSVFSHLTAALSGGPAAGH
jgi:Flp pilus assembly pilin Flp